MIQGLCLALPHRPWLRCGCRLEGVRAKLPASKVGLPEGTSAVEVLCGKAVRLAKCMASKTQAAEFGRFQLCASIQDMLERTIAAASGRSREVGGKCKSRLLGFHNASTLVVGAAALPATLWVQRIPCAKTQHDFWTGRTMLQPIPTPQETGLQDGHQRKRHLSSCGRLRPAGRQRGLAEEPGAERLGQRRRLRDASRVAVEGSNVNHKKTLCVRI